MDHKLLAQSVMNRICIDYGQGILITLACRCTLQVQFLRYNSLNKHALNHAVTPRTPQ